MEIKQGLVKLDEPTKEIHVYLKTILSTFSAVVAKCSQDSLGRVYITIKNEGLKNVK